jgi:murein DD-endopeptidase MepM/ murein hydrolase activator NlpD
MENKIKFSDQPRKVKIVYGAVIAVLCITAVVIGIMSAANRNTELPEDEPVLNIPGVDNDGEEALKPTPTPDGDGNKEENKDEAPKKLSFVSPVVGEVMKGHSLEMPVFSDTLQEWRVHTGIDISADEGSQVYASEEGMVTKVYSDPFLGKTVEITHDGGITTVYSNLESGNVAVKEGDTVNCGTLIGYVGDSSLSELADEAHLHFALRVNGVSVNPLDYLSEESKKASLGL